MYQKIELFITIAVRILLKICTSVSDYLADTRKDLERTFRDSIEFFQSQDLPDAN
jgi:hypothetical protein